MRTKVYAGRLKNHDDLLKSSSGGAFTALSDIFLDQGDAVAASVYDYSDDKLKFALFTDKATRDLARGSKYFQSDAGNIFRDSKSWLNDHPDNKLLFVGTGCQAEAFRVFMETCNLSSRVYTVDIICYGAVSPGFWRSYLNYKLPDSEYQYSALTFKDKRNGWNHPTAVLQSNCHEISIEDYVKIFYSKRALRESCYKCPFTSIDRETDITIGDFWGIDLRIPDFYDPMGNSVFLVHTERGQTLFDSICGLIDYKESSVEECMQSHLQHPTECPANRAEFWQVYKQKGLEEVIRKYAGVSIYDKAKRKIKKTLKNLRGGVIKPQPGYLFNGFSLSSSFIPSCGLGGAA